MDNYCIYRHIRLDTNTVFYIGIGNTKRPYIKKGRNTFWNRIINKTDYEVDILKYNLSWEEACELEKILISFYGRKNIKTGILCNLTDGGEGCVNLSKETRDKISLHNKGKKMSEESRLKMSNSHKGKKFTKEHRLNLSKLNLGRKHSKEFCDIISNKMSKEVLNIETGEIYKNIETLSEIININQHTLRAKIIGRVKNDTPYLHLEKYNQIGLEESLKLINLTKRLSKLKIINTVTKEIYESITDAAKDLNINRRTLRDYLYNRINNKTNLKFYET